MVGTAPRISFGFASRVLVTASGGKRNGGFRVRIGGKQTFASCNQCVSLAPIAVGPITGKAPITESSFS